MFFERVNEKSHINYMLLVCIGLIYFGNTLTLAANKHNNDSLFVDFSYMPPEWQTAICLPDDPYKSLVDKSAELLYHYHHIGGANLGCALASKSLTTWFGKNRNFIRRAYPLCELKGV